MSRLHVLVLLFAVLSLVVNLAGRIFAYHCDQQKSVRANHGDAKRQHLERDSTSFSVPLAVFVPPLWPEVSSHVPAVSEPFISTDLDNSLFTRPPPIC